MIDELGLSQTKTDNDYYLLISDIMYVTLNIQHEHNTIELNQSSKIRTSRICCIFHTKKPININTCIYRRYQSQIASYLSILIKWESEWLSKQHFYIQINHCSTLHSTLRSILNTVRSYFA